MNKPLKLILIALAILFWTFLVYTQAGRETAESYKRSLTTMQKICEELPDTVIKTDTIYLRVYSRDTVYTPVVSYIHKDTSYYYDTVRSKGLEFIIADKVDGSILSRKTSYTLDIPHIVDTIEIYKPVPRIVEVPSQMARSSYIRADIGLGYYSIGYGKIINSKHALGANVVVLDSRAFLTVGYAHLF